ncbi:hypothetical protein SS50377_24520 [Spironucleus salmonicida]|uniref:TsaA-like domain-containing protein n=1 Tax=Spironucleus salmonicida TaxID=348837 RepID=V6LMM3_9EUKA|nr:hypothetical protein SS50377_24520 [Spironucleus salmonicida]|eukprot:EST45937.1 hypothetical protein SS50377_13916 [Spironucleus salmonicida]
MQDQTSMFNNYVLYHTNNYFALREKIDTLETIIAVEQQKLIFMKKHKKNPTDANFNPKASQPPQTLIQTFYKISPLSHTENCINKKFEATRQPLLGHLADSRTTLRPPLQLPSTYALFQFHFDRNFTYRNSTLAPRQTRRVGLFSTRAPHRPNPIGLSIGRVGPNQDIIGLDLLNDTPVISATAYITAFDKADAKGGWMQNDGVTGSLLPLHYDDGVKGSFGEVFERVKKVVNLEQFAEKIEFINSKTLIDVKQYIVEQLERVPALSRTHKKIDGDQLKVIAIGLFRLLYAIKNDEITLQKVYCSVDRETAAREAEIDPEMAGVLAWYAAFE